MGVVFHIHWIPQRITGDDGGGLQQEWVPGQGCGGGPWRREGAAPSGAKPRGGWRRKLLGFSPADRMSDGDVLAGPSVIEEMTSPTHVLPS